MNIKLRIELLILFIVIPIGLALDINPAIKTTVVLIGVGYLIAQSIRLNLFTKNHLIGKVKGNFQKGMWIRLAIYIPLSTIVAFFAIPNTIFEIVFQKPIVWLGIIVFYSSVSVYFQEFVYRTYFFNRYKDQFSDKTLFIINGVVFALAHTMFKNYYVLLLTFIGGIMFACTFLKTRSLLITSIEHAIYGSWLFTLGIGKELAFPEAE